MLWLWRDSAIILSTAKHQCPLHTDSTLSINRCCDIAPVSLQTDDSATLLIYSFHLHLSYFSFFDLLTLLSTTRIHLFLYLIYLVLTEISCFLSTIPTLTPCLFQGSQFVSRPRLSLSTSPGHIQFQYLPFDPFKVSWPPVATSTLPALILAQFRYQMCTAHQLNLLLLLTPTRKSPFFPQLVIPFPAFLSQSFSAI